MFFLRFWDPEALRAHLNAAGITYRFDEYEGVDGTWDDVEVRAGSARLPTLVRRTAPATVARDWPPALYESHRCGARSLIAVHLEVPSLDETLEAYRRLLGGDERSWPGPEARSGRRRARAPLTAGELVLNEGSTDAIVGIVLGVSSLAATRAELGGRLGSLQDDVAWLDPAEAFGLRLGFTEAA